MYLIVLQFSPLNVPQFQAGAARDYKILWKEDFISFLKDSPYFTQPAVVSNTAKVQRYSDKYVNALSTKRDQLGGDFIWNRLPAELRPNFKRKSAASNGTSKKAKLRLSALDARSVEDKLKALEEKEAAKGIDGEPTATKKTTDSDDDEDDENGQDDEQDEEMDEENDYGNSYFDNGDDYNEEDDNLDDGPVY